MKKKIRMIKWRVRRWIYNFKHPEPSFDDPDAWGRWFVETSVHAIKEASGPVMDAMYPTKGSKPKRERS